MSISQRQFDHLTEMGISLWQHRNQVQAIPNTKITEQSFIHVKLADIAKQQFFGDVLLSIDISIGEVKEHNNHLDLGLFDWFFVDSNQKNEEIHFQQNSLYTPSLAQLSEQPELKQALWKMISEEIL